MEPKQTSPDSIFGRFPEIPGGGYLEFFHRQWQNNYHKISGIFCLHTKIKDKTDTFDLYLGVKITQNVAQYPLHHVTYAPAKFEVVMSND